MINQEEEKEAFPAITMERMEILAAKDAAIECLLNIKKGIETAKENFDQTDMEKLIHAEIELESAFNEVFELCTCFDLRSDIVSKLVVAFTRGVESALDVGAHARTSRMLEKYMKDTQARSAREGRKVRDAGPQKLLRNALLETEGKGIELAPDYQFANAYLEKIRERVRETASPLQLLKLKDSWPSLSTIQRATDKLFKERSHPTLKE